MCGCPEDLWSKDLEATIVEDTILQRGNISAEVTGLLTQFTLHSRVHYFAGTKIYIYIYKKKTS